MTVILLFLPLFLNFEYHDWLIYAFARSNKYSWIIDDSPNLLYRQHSNNFIGSNTRIPGFYLRIEQILNGTWPKNIWFEDS